jgi:hypothetical protein
MSKKKLKRNPSYKKKKIKGKLVSHVKSINSHIGGEFESDVFKKMSKEKQKSVVNTVFR